MTTAPPHQRPSLMPALRTAWTLAAIASLTAPSAHAESPLPPGLRTRAYVDKPQFVIGENVIVHYEISNHGEAPFKVGTGGDSRGQARHQRFRATAIGPDGAAAEDPFPPASGIFGGGFLRDDEMKSGESFVLNVPLPRYVRLDQPGRYHIQVGHDLATSKADFRYGDLGDPATDPRWASVDVVMVEPTPAQAAAVVAAMKTAPDAMTSRGEPAAPWADYVGMVLPVYLDPLRQLAATGEQQAVFGLAQIRTPEATMALIALLNSSNDDIAQSALWAVGGRLPLANDAPLGPWLSEEGADLRRRIAAIAWTTQATSAATAQAWQWLNDPPASWDDRRYTSAAALLRNLARPDDMPKLIAALDRALAFTEGRFPPRSPLTYGNVDALGRVATTLLKHGAAAPTEPASPGEIAVCIYAWGNGQAPIEGNPNAEQAMAWLDHPLPYVRRLVLLHLPPPFPKSLPSRLPALLSHEDVGVRFAAARTMTQAAMPSMVETALERLAVEEDEWVFSALIEGLQKAGAPRDRVLLTCVDRIGDEVLYHRAFGVLIAIFEDAGGHGWSGKPQPQEMQRVAERWRQWIADNRDRIRWDRPILLDDPAVTADLFPDNFTVDRNGAPWPTPAERPAAAPQ